MTQLVHYDTARRELAAAHAIDEVKGILDKSVAMAKYAAMAKDAELSKYATEIRLRAERRIGEMMREMREAGKLAKNKPGPGRGHKGEKAGGKNPPAFDEPKTLLDQGIDKDLAKRCRDAAKMAEDKYEKKIKRQAALAEVAASVTKKPSNPRSEHTGKYEWYTPKEYIDAARKVMGDIDLDPATSAKAQEVVQATKFLTEADDGLKAYWEGKVWLNPPYKQPLIEEFATKMVTEVRAGRVSEAVMLTNNSTDTEWFHTAFGACSAICFTRGRVKFYNPEGDAAGPTQGQAFFYFGNNPDKFCNVFASIGFVVQPMATAEDVKEAA